MNAKAKTIVIVAIIGVIIFMAVFAVNGARLNAAYTSEGQTTLKAYDIDGNVIFPDWPRGNLTSVASVALPDLYETGKGFTCTGLAYDAASNTYLIGDIGALQPGGTIKSQIVRLSADFTTVTETIKLYELFPSLQDVQGVAIDPNTDTIWFCCPSADTVYNISKTGSYIKSFSVSRPTGVAFCSADNTLWVLTYNSKIIHFSSQGGVLATYDFAYEEQLDQCCLDEGTGLLYITAGANYTSRNNVYCFDTATHAQFIACTVDSYSVEGIWVSASKMVIVNDGYYHSAAVAVNQLNLYAP